MQSSNLDWLIAGSKIPFMVSFDTLIAPYSFIEFVRFSSAYIYDTTMAHNEKYHDLFLRKFKQKQTAIKCFW